MQSKICLFLLIIFSLNADAQRKKINIKITYQKQYCGGARPTEEIQREAEKERPYCCNTIIIISEKGQVDSVKTNKLGVLKLWLGDGVYKLVEPWRYYRVTPDGTGAENFNEECLMNEWSRENKILTIKSGRFTVKDNAPFIAYCNWRMPCLSDSSGREVPD